MMSNENEINSESEINLEDVAGGTGSSESLYPDKVAGEGLHRVVNNVHRHNYRILSESEKEAMKAVKDLGLDFSNLLHGIGETDPAGDRLASRELSLAQTKIEEAVMWAVKHITR